MLISIRGSAPCLAGRSINAVSRLASGPAAATAISSLYERVERTLMENPGILGRGTPSLCPRMKSAARCPISCIRTARSVMRAPSTPSNPSITRIQKRAENTRRIMSLKPPFAFIVLLMCIKIASLKCAKGRKCARAPPFTCISPCRVI